MNEPSSDYDSPWKEALERYFEPFMAFFFPQAHAEIDWAKGYEFLDKELQQVVRDASIGRKYVDKRVKVWIKNGSEAWVLVHIEVQSQKETGFAERMYIYHLRLFDRFHRLVASFAVLGDEDADWRPDPFGYHLWGCEIGFKFPIVKLLDYKERWAFLEASRNPFAKVVMAHLLAQETRGKMTDRLQWKLSLVKGLYEQGFHREDILELFRFIDWLLALPADLDRRFDEEITHYEEEKQMTYITSVERIGIQKGMLQKAQEDVLDVLETRFATVPSPVVRAINEVEDLSLLKHLHKQAIRADSLSAFEETLNGNQ